MFNDILRHELISHAQQRKGRNGRIGYFGRPKRTFIGLAHECISLKIYVSYLKYRDVTALSAELYCDQVDWLAPGAVFVGVTPRFWAPFPPL
jgi:hypothetical protein